MHGGKETVKVVHRVALFDAESRITHIVSQSDIARSVVCCPDQQWRCEIIWQLGIWSTDLIAPQSQTLKRIPKEAAAFEAQFDKILGLTAAD